MGKIFIILASLGIIFSVAGIGATWIIKPRFQVALLGIIDSLDKTLISTDEGLLIVDGILNDSKENLSIIKTTLETLDSTIVNISVSLDTSGKLIGDDLRLTVTDTQTALSSAATSAKLIDDTVAILAQIPYLGANYQPDVPLHISLEQVAGSMNDMPEALETIEQSLGNTADGLNDINTNLSELSDNINNFEADLADAQLVLIEYGNFIDQAEKTTSKLYNNLARYLTLLSLFLTGILLSLGFAQASILVQGFAYMQGKQQIVNLADIRRE